MSTIAVIGTGYVGLVSGACLADFGNHVTCVDVDQVKIKRLRAGEIPIFEPGLDAIVAATAAAGRLFFSTDLESAVKANDVVFIAVGRPREVDGSADLRHVEAAARAIGRAMNGHKVIVNKSTVPWERGGKFRPGLPRSSRGQGFPTPSTSFPTGFSGRLGSAGFHASGSGGHRGRPSAGAGCHERSLPSAVPQRDSVYRDEP